MKLRSLFFIASALVIIVLVTIYVMRQPPAPAPAPGPAAGPVPPAEAVPPEDIERNNRGVGLMGQYEYPEAREIFAELCEKYPDNHDLRVNLAIATLNRQEEGDEQAALDMLADVLRDEPDHLRAQYCSGLLKLYLGDPDAALEHFRFVAERDPRDAHAAYYVAQTLAQARTYSEALEWYEKTVELNPYLRSAYYGRFQMLQRLNRPDEAQHMLDAFERLKTNPRATLVEFVYTKMGPKGEAVAIGVPTPPAPAPEGPVFRGAEFLLAASHDVRWPALDREWPASVTACDLTGDGAIDLYVPGAIDREGAVNAVCINDGSDRFTLNLDHPLARIPDVHAALWGDYDNDGLVDVYLCRQGPNMLWRQSAPDQWEDVTEATGTANGSFNTVNGLFVDADHDGDLDLFCVNADGPNELLNNNRDGTFTSIAADQNIAGDGGGSRQILTVDIDRDRDLDLLVINDAPPHELYINDRMWQYRADAGVIDAGRLITSDVIAAVAGDTNADGQAELFTLSRAGLVQRWQRDGSGVLRPQPFATYTFNHDDTLAITGQLALADVTGDGQWELIISAAGGWMATTVEEDGAGEMVYHTDGLAMAGFGLLMTDPQHGPGVVGLPGDGQPLHVWHAGSGRHNFAALSFTGREDAGQSMRSNASGIGTHFAARIGSRWVAGSTLPTHSGPGQSRQPVAVGLGGHDGIDFVSIDWSDGIFQSELHLTTGEVHTIAETQRQLSSCPVLFAWDGERYRFISDVLGVGGMGYALEPGVYAEPRPWERFLFPLEVLQPKNGRYHIKLGEPMEEACYLDAARLVAYDVPEGWAMTLDERFAIGGPAPTGEPRFYRRSMAPLLAVNDRGDNVTEAVQDVDDVAAPVGELDERFIGRLKDDHILTLTFPEPIDAAGEPDALPLLIIDGWVEYPYAQTMFAAWQAKAAFRAPTLEARDAAGRWRTVVQHFGYPAGMPRQMSLPLTSLPPGTTSLRLTTNQEVYFDRIMVAWAEPCPEVVRRPLELTAATLIRAGFAQRVVQPQRRPHYDYRNRPPFWDTRHQAGFYTRFGAVDGLLQDADGALAIFGPGEEAHMEFAAPSTAPRENNVRRYLVLEVEGWCKDLDLFTHHGETIAPLPAEPATENAMNMSRMRNIRYESGRRP